MRGSLAGIGRSARAINLGSFPVIRILGRLVVPARSIDKTENAALFRDEAVDAAELS